MSYETDTDLEAAPQTPGTTSPFGHLVDGLSGAGSLLIFAIMFLMCADVLARDLFNKPIDGVAEIVAISIIAIVYLQLASTLRHGRMARAEVFIDGFVVRHPRAGHALTMVFNLIGAAMCAVVFYATRPTFVKAWTNDEFFGVEGVFTAPTWPAMLVVLIGTSITAVQYLLMAWADLRIMLGAPAGTRKS